MVAKLLNRWHRFLGRVNKKLADIKTLIRLKMILMLAHFLNFFSSRALGDTKEIKIKTAKVNEITLNLLGMINVNANSTAYTSELDSVGRLLNRADLSISSVRCTERGEKNLKLLKNNMKKYHIIDVGGDNDYIKSRLYRSIAGNFAVISYKRGAVSAKKKHNTIALVRETLRLKKAGADYVILYVDNGNFRTVPARRKKFYDELARMGVDYVFAVTPAVIDAGTTWKEKNNSIARATYSGGTFLTNAKKDVKERVIFRVKLRKVNGVLQAYQEAYYPLKWKMSNRKMRVIHSNSTSKDDIKSLAILENNMARLRTVENMLTVKQLMTAIGQELPPKYNWLSDFSFNKLHTVKKGTIMADDIFFRWQPWTEINDAPTFKKRQKFGIHIAKRLSKKLMFEVSYKKLNLSCPYIVVEDTTRAYMTAIHYLRSKKNFRCVAITGSIGKTSTKDMLAEVMNMKYITVKSNKNENTQTKIGPSIQRITSDCEVYIQEMGGGRPGGASRHSTMVMPDAAVVTNIGDAHIGNFDGDQIKLMHNKLEITHGLVPGGILYLNGDDPLLATVETDVPTVRFAVHNTEADFYAEDVTEGIDTTTFVIVHGNHKVKAKVNLLGEHNVLNAICSYAIGLQYNIPEKKIIAGMLNFKPEGIRQNLVQYAGVKIYLDCFNASSGSVVTSLKTLNLIPCGEGGRHIALLGDITGQQELAEETHKNMGQICLENPADLFIFLGDMTKIAYDIVKEHGLNAIYTADEKEFVELVRKNVHSGDVVSVKGSSKLKLEYKIDTLFGTRFYDQHMLDSNLYRRSIKGDVLYNVFRTHATAIGPRTKVKIKSGDLKIRRKVGGVVTYNIGSLFKRHEEITSVTMPKTIRHIGKGAFASCVNLKSVVGTSGLMTIESDAFKYCTSLTSFELPDGLKHIGSRAFLGCSSLTKLVIPETVTDIGKGAFKECNNLKLYCKEGSYASKYFKENKIDYNAI